MKDTELSVQTVLRYILACEPPLGGQVREIAGIQEAVIAGVRKEGFECEQQYRPDTGEECNQYQYGTDDIFAYLAKIDLGQLSRFTRNRRVILPALQAHLVNAQDQDTEDHHYDRKNTCFARIF